MESSARSGGAASLPNTRQQHGSIETFLTSNKMGLHQCPKIELQSKETLMDLWSAAWLWEWLRRRHVDAWLLCRRQAVPR